MHFCRGSSPKYLLCCLWLYPEPLSVVLNQFASTHHAIDTDSAEQGTPESVPEGGVGASNAGRFPRLLFTLMSYLRKLIIVVTPMRRNLFRRKCNGDLLTLLVPCPPKRLGYTVGASPYVCRGDIERGGRGLLLHPGRLQWQPAQVRTHVPRYRLDRRGTDDEKPFTEPSQNLHNPSSGVVCVGSLYTQQNRTFQHYTRIFHLVTNDFISVIPGRVV